MSKFRQNLLLALWLIASGTGLAQEKPAGVAEFNDFRAKPLDGWEWDEDERLGDLIAQLREKESSLQALDARIAKAMGKKAGAKMDENMAWRNNNRMDLKGGGPIRWDAFYGRNAEKFFYHPVDANTTYHTNTLLQQTSPTAAAGVPGNQGVPAHQRPPQFDYIYRGWEKEQQRAKEKAEELKGKMDEMVFRRRALEQDVVILWCKLAFRIIDKEKLSEKPLLRWAVIPKSPDAAVDVERAAVLTKATQLLATALLFNDSFVEQDAPKAFSTVDAVIKKSRRQFEDGLLDTETLLDESEDVATAVGKYKRLSRKLEDVSKSLTEGYKGWKEGDSTDDEPAKYASLRRIQDSVVTYSQVLLSLNELVGVMKKQWGTKINTKSTEFAPVWDVAHKPTSLPHTSSPDKLSAQGRGTDSQRQKTESLLGLVNIQRDSLQGNWNRQNNGVVVTDGGAFAMMKIPCNAPQFYDLTVSFRKRGGGAVNVCIPTGRTQTMIAMNVFDKVTKIDVVDGQGLVILDKPLFGADERCTITIKVRENSIQLLKGNVPLARWQGSFERLSCYHEWPPGVPPRGFGLGVCRDAVEFYEVELRAVE